MGGEYLTQVGNRLVKRCGTRDPFEIAEHLGVEVLFCENFGALKGMYRVIKRNRFIFINKQIYPTPSIFYRAKSLHWPSKIHLWHLKFSPSESLKIFTVLPIYTLFPSSHSLLPFSYNVRTPLAVLLFSHTVSTIFLSHTLPLFLPRPFPSRHCSPLIFYNVQFPSFSKSIHFSSLTTNEKTEVRDSSLSSV